MTPSPFAACWSALPLLLLILATATGVEAIWPFKEKRFKDEAFIDAGSLGLEGVKGRVVATGDWGGDQKLDLFTLNEDEKTITIHQWNRGKFRFTPSHTLTLSSKISNVIPGDYNHDGHLDLLVMYAREDDGSWWGGKVERLGMEVYLGGGTDGGFQSGSWKLDTSVPAQPIIYDADASLRPSLLGLAPTEENAEGALRSWTNNGTVPRDSGFPPVSSSSQACTLANPHSSAFVDIDGDCLPDLVLHCAEPKTTHHSIQIWLNRGQNGYVLSRSYDLPAGSGPLSFADMNRDGSIDIVFPTCNSHSKSSGLGKQCSINIAYNKQVPVCSTEGSQATKEGKLKCRGWAELCLVDETFEFSFDESDSDFSSIQLTALLPSELETEDVSLLLHVPHNKHIPLPLRAGDFNVDGFPDLLLVVHNATAVPPSGGVFGNERRPGNQLKVLVNSPCSGKGVVGCDKGSSGKGKRGFKVGKGQGWDAMEELWDAEGASWMDIDDDGSLDILVHRSGAQSRESMTFIQNNFYHDAFFLKAQVLNGVCDGKCEPIDGGKAYSPMGVSYSGATYKFTVLDPLGRRVAQQVSQLPQTGYHSLHTPYAFFGLGRTNNYVEKLFIGTSLPPPNHHTYLESLIPNSQIIINPPYPVIDDPGFSNDNNHQAAATEVDTDPDSSLPLFLSRRAEDGLPAEPPVTAAPPYSPVKARSTEWKSQLYLKPGDWVPWVGIAVLGTVLTLGSVVVWLNEREKKEDEKERRRALHAINFQAL
ncbi:hypothetical protein I316_01452 [Kwoniella heveanensis BCC8398]|uniref:T-cell immunomodulatory protein TIP C2 domain-containing protein n=1 Tax=Kwoniella heveanensis BCC8398 TaxID=1296120 RepID=A0A1B9H0R2_9TREE|nr:hypothetical protein I316_01452 [Kwoniella heveanensis BCC8398]